ncbi:MAG TPA: hypothetical protein VMQ93_06380 [Novosphingobium sp.]|nr:hypothetical protein [Novosphingobium sp.]
MDPTKMHFRNFMAIDWSGALGERQKGIAVALCGEGDEPPRLLAPPGHAKWSREDVLDLLLHRLPPDTLVGMDLGISLPFADAGAFFPGWAQSPPDARALWSLIDAVCAKDPHLAAASFVDHPELSAYFRRHGGREGLQFHLPGALHKRGRMRVTEAAQARAGCKPYSNFNLVGAAQVGKSSLTGMRLLHRLGGRLPVWPVDPLPQRGSVLVEIYTTLAAVAAGRTASRAKMTDHAALDAALIELGSLPGGGSGPIDDHSADALVTAAWLRTCAHRADLWHPAGLTADLAITEGWTFGAP